jgi:hypothetical protein
MRSKGESVPRRRALAGSGGITEGLIEYASREIRSIGKMAKVVALCSTGR